MHIIRMNMLMNAGRMVFRRIIAHVFLLGLIMKFEILLSFLVQQPEVTHFRGKGALTFDSVINNANNSSVVNVYWCWRLWMPKLIQGKMKDFGFLGIKEDPNLASAADAAISLRMVQVMSIAPFSVIGSPSMGILPRKK
jgi:hypothetical protein